MSLNSNDRGEWGSKIGFIFAAAGSAIGLGNIWRFPYVTGVNGGAAFVFVYLVCVLVIGLPYLYAELALGRAIQKNPVGAIASLKPNSLWIWIGGLGIITGVFILSYYAVIAGWTFGYIFKMLIPNQMSFSVFVANPFLVILLFGIFIVLTVAVVYGGIEGGIEKWAKILMPILLLLLILLIIYTNLLPGSGRGLTFYLKPDFSKINGKIILAALGQAFFSLSLGMGLMVTYGSYISKKDNLITSGIYVVLADTVIAIMAGLIIFPALFAMNQDPAAGPGLVFNVLPAIFQNMPFGIPIGVVFFILLSIAALTSTISLLEVPTAYLVDEKGVARKIAVWIVGIVVFFIGLPSALSQGAVTWFSVPIVEKMEFLSLMDFIWGNLSLAVGAFLLSIFVGWVWGAKHAAKELALGNKSFHKWAPIWGFLIRFICPITIFIILLNLFQIF
ncbi:Na+-dependent transporter [miscellaneous Crenarchaeota group archaeon SMTZ-80]|jgi:NSS family neurotransmitter:Na+ symporter|nr:MAG: Na+-dependent transporter [miscellaneous Crenarchaeota group archaeon SMTZ-80]